MKYGLLILLSTFLVMGSFGLVKSQPFIHAHSKPGITRILQPGKDFPDYPPLSADGINRSLSLPPLVDNSGQPYMRPVFSQSGASCGQSASVGYNFCYEINRMRNLPADTSLNQYPDHFTYNFLNATSPYYGEGVSYFHTFDILYDAGNPTVAVYGSMDTDNYHWMSGYEKYYSSLQNRISGVSSIDVGSPEGLMLLKHWLHNHLDGSGVGGVASFYAGLNALSLLPAGSAEAGKNVVVEWFSEASHAMTIVGYNDSIRFDRNGDGIFTNTIDINGDSIVDMRDWEIGGLIFVNSYGDHWGDEGFCYMLYSTLATKYGEGGIWNNSVHVLSPDTLRDVLLTLKVRMKYNKRGRIKLSAGISQDTSRYVPEHTMDFSVFNFQGGDFYMNGSSFDPEGKNLEIGLDITPLLSYVEAGSLARIFLIVDEKDPDNSGEGEILDFEVINYSENIPTTFKSNETPAAISNNNRSLISAIFTNDNNPPSISMDEIQLVAAGNNYSVPAEVSGGSSPYAWQIQPIYHTTDSLGVYSPSQGDVLIPTDNSTGYAEVHLSFPFHFFGIDYDTVYMYANGYLMFERTDMPYYYLLFDDSYFRQIKSVAGCMNHELGLYGQADFLKAEVSTDKAVFWWRLSNEELSETIEFSVTLFPDGSVSFQYGSVSLSSIMPISGVSSGNFRNYYPSARNGLLPINGEIRKMMPGLSANVASVSSEGIIALQIPEDFVYGQFSLLATDKNSLTAEKIVTLSTGPVIQIKPSDPSATFSPGATVPLSVFIENSGTQAFENVRINLNAGSSNVIVSGSYPDFSIELGETVVINEAFYLKVADSVKSVQRLTVEGMLSVNGSGIETFSCFESSFPVLVVSPPVVIDLNNNIAEPGEKVELFFDITNMGNASAGDIIATLSISSPFAALCNNSAIEVGELGAFSRKRISFPLQVNDASPSGILIYMTLRVESQLAGTREDACFVSIGSTKIGIIDMDENENSAIHLISAIIQNNINCDRLEIIDSLMFNYDIVFLCLGSFMHNHSLNPAEDSLLVSFLNRGGSLYLEGGTFFKQDQVTNLRSRFGVTGATQAWMHPADTLLGIEGTPLEGIKIDYRGEYVRSENLVPIGAAEPWLSDKLSSLNFVVVRDSADVKTIASTVEFGGLFMYDGPGRSDLVRHYLDFLGLPLDPFCASFNASMTNICSGNTVSFLSTYSQMPTSWNWSFPGGTPEVWNGPEPVIKYDSAGAFDVELIVTNGIETNTFSVNKMIVVDNCIGVAEPKVSSLKVYPNPASNLIAMELPFISGAVGLCLIDVRGVEILSQRIQIENHMGQLSLPDLEGGVYILRVTTGSQTFATKLIIRY